MSCVWSNIARRSNWEFGLNQQIFTVDGAQVAGNIPVNVDSIGCHGYATVGTSGYVVLMGQDLRYPGNMLELMLIMSEPTLISVISCVTVKHVD